MNSVTCDSPLSRRKFTLPLPFLPRQAPLHADVWRVTQFLMLLTFFHCALGSHRRSTGLVGGQLIKQGGKIQSFGVDIATTEVLIVNLMRAIDVAPTHASIFGFFFRLRLFH